MNRREFRTRGEIRYTADDKDVESMSPGAMLVIERAQGWNNVERVVFEGTGDTIVRRYYIDGAERSYDGAGQRFAAGMLGPWVREQGGNIPERVQRLLGEKGVAHRR